MKSEALTTDLYGDIIAYLDREKIEHHARDDVIVIKSDSRYTLEIYADDTCALIHLAYPGWQIPIKHDLEYMNIPVFMFKPAVARTLETVIFVIRKIIDRDDEWKRIEAALEPTPE